MSDKQVFLQMCEADRLLTIGQRIDGSVKFTDHKQPQTQDIFF